MAESGRTIHFRPQARLVEILGLIELVKNAYDADATGVRVELAGLSERESTTIIVSDDVVLLPGRGGHSLLSSSSKLECANCVPNSQNPPDLTQTKPAVHLVQTQ